MNIKPQLIQACRQNQRSAQVEMYRLCYEPLMKICLRYKKDECDAAAMLNAGMMKVLDRLDTYSDDVPFEFWSKRIMINVLIDDYRKHKKHNSMVQSYEPDQLTGVNGKKATNAGIERLEADDIMNIIRTLPEERKQVFNLFAIDGYTYKQIADELDMNINTCKWHVAEARKYLQEKIRSTLIHSNTNKNEPVR